MQTEFVYRLGASALGAAALVGFALAGPAPAAAAEVELTCAHDQPVAKGAEGYKEIQWQYFKKTVEEKSNGRIAVKVLGAGQLGDVPALIENMKIGTVDCTDISAATGGPFIPAISILSVPYVIENLEHRARIVDTDGPVFAEVARLVKEKLDATLMGTEHSSVRSVYTRTKPVMTPDDLKGLKIRTMQSKAQVSSWQALGASPTAIAFAEVYAALQAGVVDAAENSPMFLWNMKHYEAVKYYSLTKHLMNTGFSMISNRALAKIPADLRDMVIEAGREGSARGRQYDIDVDSKFMKQITDAGVIVNDVDTAPFVALAVGVHDELAKELGGENLLMLAREEAKKAMK